MPESTQPLPNPYVGPRSFRYGEKLYGREQEVPALLDLLIAERVVLLYSPSGAGKTSLVQAALIPELMNEEFDVLPVMRVNKELPPELKGVKSANRYLVSLFLYLEEGLPRDQQTPLTEIPRIKFTDYLNRRQAKTNGGKPLVLIFDQFEEVLTVDPTDRAAKEAFFAQVGTALRDRERWALFVMREEYLAGMDPYLRAIPTRFVNSFRLELLGKDAATRAVQEPASNVSVIFKDSAAKILVDDLSRISVQQADGTMVRQDGLYVEPVQLQVVCSRLWEKEPRKANQTIDEEAIKDLGDVDYALAGYYADKVKAVAAETGVKERLIREWFDRQLITEHGIRGQVLLGPEASGELDNRAIWPLVDAHLVRGERVRGATWFELAHDRLIKPIQKNNVDWFRATLSLLQRQAILWSNQSASEGKALLLKDQDLIDAISWAEANQDEMGKVENEFLAACKEKRAQKTRQIWLWGSTAAIVLLLLIATFAGLMLMKEKELSKKERELHEYRLAQAEAKAETNRKINEANECRDKAYISIQNRDYQDALNQLDKSGTIFSELKDLSKQARILLEIGKVHALKRDYVQAKRLFLEAEEINKSRNDRELQGNVLECRASLSEQEGQRAVAAGFYEEALTNYLAAGSLMGSGRVSERLAVYAEEYKYFNKAAQLYQSALNSYTVAGDRLGVTRAEKALARINPWGYLTDIRSSAIHELRGEKITIGRSITDSAVQNDITFSNRNISRHHLEIRADRTAEDLRSRNGTALNATQLYYGRGINLKDGDILTLANIEVMQFSSSKPKAPVRILTGAWAIYIDNVSRQVHYLTEAAYSLVYLNGMLIPKPGHSDPALVKLRRIHNRAEMFKTRDSWTAMCEVKQTDYDYTTYLLKDGEWIEALDVPMRLVKLSRDRKKIETEGPRFQIILSAR